MDDLKFAEQRTGEIGVRRALSAQTADVLRLIVNHNLLLFAATMATLELANAVACLVPARRSLWLSPFKH
ncbi:MAG: hypothetical protein DMF24_00015 [Verrucomicrobia bacterium]|nr:MAG: hypothetical protein DMF24_00015 [Verrucomicrobiota bacterium]